VSALVDCATDWARLPAETSLDWAAIGAELAAFALLVAIAALLAWAFSDPPTLVGLPVVVLASLPMVQLASVGPSIVAAFDEAPDWLADTVYYLVLAWYAAVLVRSAYVVLQPHRLRFWRALAAGALLTAPLGLPPDMLPTASWWTQAADALAMDATSPVAEPVVALQRELQDQALGALEEHRQGEIDLYFIAFAPDGAGASWRPRIEKAREVMDRHWSTEARSITYVNDATNLTEAPMATVTHLREALEEVAASIDPDEDIVMLFVGGRSNPDGSMRVSLPPLGLVQLSGPGLAHLFREAGIRWRVIVAAVCNPQPFVEALADENTLIVAAAGPGETAAGCARGGEPTSLPDVLFGEALTSAATLPAAFQLVQRRLAEHGVHPVVHVGEAIAPRLARLRGTTGGRAAVTLPRGG
jgi:hypothetical protein